MTQVKAIEVKIGDELYMDADFKKYGYYKDAIVTGIRTTKSGRIQIEYKRTYVSPEGIEHPVQYGAHVSHLPIAPNTLVALI